jgi:acetyl-CoA C-acetyltransferase
MVAAPRMRRAAFVLGCARTPFGSLGGALAGLPPIEPALTAASSAADHAGIDPKEIEAIVAAVGVPTESLDLALAAALGGRLGLETAVPTTTILGLDAAAEALTAGVRLAAAEGAGPTLVVAADSASRAAYWVPGLRLGASEQGAFAIDPLGLALDPLSGDGAPAYLLEAAASERGISRAEQDEFSAGSHKAAAARSGSEADPVIPQRLPGGSMLEADELLRAEVSAQALGESTPLYSPGGSLTATNTAVPIDGAAALILGREGKSGPEIGPPVRRAAERPGSSAAESAARAALELAGLAAPEVDRVRLGECSAAQALIAISDLGLDPELVWGGSLACGRPVGGAAVALAVELTAELDAAGAGTGLLADEGPAGTGVAAVLSRG